MTKQTGNGPRYYRFAPGPVTAKGGLLTKSPLVHLRGPRPIGPNKVIPSAFAAPCKCVRKVAEALTRGTRNHQPVGPECWPTQKREGEQTSLHGGALIIIRL